MRRFIAWKLHCWGDRVDPDRAYRVSGMTFTFEKGRGAVLRWDGRGCPLLYAGMDNYRRAHDEAGGLDE